MSEAKDPAIKLFGKTIPVPENPQGGGTSSTSSSSACGDGGNNRIYDDIALDHDRPSCARRNGEEGEALQDSPKEKDENDVAFATEDDSSKPDATSGKNESSEAPSAEKECSSSKSTKTGDEESDKNNSQEKTLKKPDKILPCPRCNSMDTKFCYYNNYNVNQPRHFCKNCQRYWTAGGTMRNVPVGAGRRKNKSSASHYRQISVPEALQNVRADVPNGVHPSLKTDGTVLTFGSDFPLHESMASVLNLTDKTLRNGAANGFHHLQPLAIPVSYEGGKSGMDHSEPNLKDETGKSGSQETVMKNYNGFPPQLQCFPGAPWPYPWNSAQWRSPVPPGLCPPGFAMPIFPAATYWGCTLPGPWNIPWIVSPSSPKQGAPSSGANSPTLGKHSRDENMLAPSDSREGEPLKENSTERCLWIPKTLRIDDPEEAAKSSIWTTLGIRNEKPDSIGSHGLFKPFEVKSDSKHQTNGTCPVLQANPAALSRSVKFHESS